MISTDDMIAKVVGDLRILIEVRARLRAENEADIREIRSLCTRIVEIDKRIAERERQLAPIEEDLKRRGLP